MVFLLQSDNEPINHQILESSGQPRLNRPSIYFITFPLSFCLHLPLFLCSLVSVSSLTSSYFWLPLLFGSSHPSILLAGWPKSCAVLELCSGRCKLSVALYSHTFPPLSSCSHCVHEPGRKVRAVARLMRKREMERKTDRSVSVTENKNLSRLFQNNKEQEWRCMLKKGFSLIVRNCMHLCPPSPVTHLEKQYRDGTFNGLKHNSSFFPTVRLRAPWRMSWNFH